MAASRIANRKSTKHAPRLVETPEQGEWRRVSFRSSGAAYISLLLALGARLPSVRHDGSRLVGDFDAKAKKDLVEDLHLASSGLVRIVRQLGLLMTGQGETSPPIEDEIVEIGFTLDGIGDLVLSIYSIDARHAASR